MKAYSNSPDTRIALLEQSIGHINETLIRFEKRFDKIDEQFSEIRRESKIQLRWIVGVIITLFSLPIIQNIITHFWSH